MKSFIQFLKNWTLPISMSTGIVLYLIYHNLPILHPAGPFLNRFCVTAQPVLIFVMLFLQFNKVSPKELKFKRWHLWLLLIQGSVFTGLGLILAGRPETYSGILLETAMLCLICPTAIAAGVITDKLGGSLPEIMTYVAMINMLVSVLVPSIVPLVHPEAGRTFIMSFWIIIKKIFPMLFLPCITAWIIRYTIPGLQKWLMKYAGTAFYLWGFSLVISLALTTRSLILSHMTLIYAIWIGLISLTCCIVQFYLGRLIGSGYGKKTAITAGQALGQKNTVFIIWLGYTFMTPATSIAGGFYCIWHNLVNSYELYRQRHNVGI
jgi:BASS family bile acid:Na+ symporter